MKDEFIYYKASPPLTGLFRRNKTTGEFFYFWRFKSKEHEQNSWVLWDNYTTNPYSLIEITKEEMFTELI